MHEKASERSKLFWTPKLRRVYTGRVASSDMESQKVESLIRNEFPEAEIEVVAEDHEDERSDGDHFGLVIVSEEFDGMSRVDRHRAVYDALGEAMGGEIHAVEIRAQTPEEA
jgi:stress-induced morphogen